MLALLILVLPTSCTQLVYRTLYNNLDNILFHEINSFINLDAGQKRFIEQSISVHHRWHRLNALPRLIPILKKVQAAVRTGFTETGEREIFELINAEVRMTANHVADDAASFFTSITDDQIEYFKEKCNDYVNDMEKEENRAREKVISHRLNNIVSQLETYYGDFSFSQKEDIRKILESSSNRQNVRIAYLRATQVHFINLLENKTEKNIIKKYIIGWATRDEKFLPDDVKNIFAEQQKESRRIRLLIDKTIITKEQRDEGIKKLDDLIETINILINQQA